MLNLPPAVTEPGNRFTSLVAGPVVAAAKGVMMSKQQQASFGFKFPSFSAFRLHRSSIPWVLTSRILAIQLRRLIYDLQSSRFARIVQEQAVHISPSPSYKKMLFSAGLIGLLLPLATATIDGQVHQLHARQAIPSSPSGSNSTSNVTITPTQTVLTGDGANVTVQGGFARRTAVDSAPFRITNIALVAIQV